MRTFRIVAALLIGILIAPSIGMFGARGLARVLSCTLDTATPHPCIALGVDIGDLLFKAHLYGWLGFLLIWWIPAVLAIAMVWSFVEMVHHVRRSKNAK